MNVRNTCISCDHRECVTLQKVQSNRTKMLWKHMQVHIKNWNSIHTTAHIFSACYSSRSFIRCFDCSFQETEKIVSVTEQDTKSKINQFMSH